MFEVSRVANGFMVRPQTGPDGYRGIAFLSDVHVFNKFEDLSEFLRVNLTPEPPK